MLKGNRLTSSNNKKPNNLIKIIILFGLFLSILISVSSSLTILSPKYRPAIATSNYEAPEITGEMLYRLISYENHYFLKSFETKSELPSISKILLSFTTKISLEDPRSFLGRELPGFTFFDSQIVVAGDGTNYTNMPFESSPPLEVLMAEKEASLQNIESLKVDDSKELPKPTQTTGDKKVVYIYFSHTRESFLPHLKGIEEPNEAYHSKVNVTQIGDKLAEELKNRGIGATVDKTDVIANLLKKERKYWQAYDESRHVVKEALASNSDFTYLFDIHRDSKRKKATTLSIEGEDYAKLAFVIGKKHQNYEKNIRLANELHEKLQEKYPGLSRGVLAKGGKGENGKYNQDLSENAILIEFGGVDNTFDELYRTAAALADVFSDLYWQAEEVNKPL